MPERALVRDGLVRINQAVYNHGGIDLMRLAGLLSEHSMNWRKAAEEYEKRIKG